MVQFSTVKFRVPNILPPLTMKVVNVGGQSCNIWAIILSLASSAARLVLRRGGADTAGSSGDASSALLTRGMGIEGSPDSSLSVVPGSV